MSARHKRDIVIVGGGTAGWMAAAALARFAGEVSTVRLIESDAIGTIGVGEATIPQIHLFNQGLGIDEDHFVAETQGSFKLGIEFVGWHDPAARYIHAFGAIGRGLGLTLFHHYWLRHRAEGGTTALWDYSSSALAAAANRFARDRGRPDLPSGLGWAYHFDAGLYAAFLRRYAEARGVVRLEGEVVDVARHAETGEVASVKLADGREVAGEFFIDCSGFRGLLIEQALSAGYENWSNYLPCDRALAVPCERVAPLTPYTRATAREAGWQWRIPLQHRTGNGHVYCSNFTSDEVAADTLLANLDGKALADPRPLRFVTGKRRRAWVGNVVALGLASGFMEPLESTSIHLIQSGIARLLQLFPQTGDNRVQAAEFNRQTDCEWTAIRDFLVFHYKANGRAGEFWRMCREMPVPDSLAARIDLFRASGRIVRQQEELFTEVGWLQVMTGQGIVPERYDPLADRLSSADLAEFLLLAQRHAKGVVERMPDHADFLARHCAAAAPTMVAA